MKEIEFKKGDKITLEDNRRNWRIYEIPVELINDYISFAKLYFENKVWKVLERGMKLLKKEQSNAKDLEGRIVELEKEILILKEKIKEEEKKSIMTFGGSTNTTSGSTWTIPEEEVGGEKNEDK